MLVLHQVRIFCCIIIKIPHDAYSAESLFSKKLLRCKICLAHLKQNAVTPLMGEFADEFFHHALTNGLPAEFRMNRKIKNVESCFMELKHHECNNSFFNLRNHADAIALPKAADEILFRPWTLKTLILDIQHFRHISADHPSNMNAYLLRVAAVGTTIRRTSLLMTLATFSIIGI